MRNVYVSTHARHRERLIQCAVVERGGNMPTELRIENGAEDDDEDDWSYMGHSGGANYLILF